MTRTFADSTSITVLPVNTTTVTVTSNLGHVQVEMNIRTTLCLLCLALCVLIMDLHRWGCGLPCPREFSDSAGLARHRRACHHYKHRLDLQAQNFKRRAREDPKHTKVFKRMKPSDETQVRDTSIIIHE